MSESQQQQTPQEASHPSQVSNTSHTSVQPGNARSRSKKDIIIAISLFIVSFACFYGGIRIASVSPQGFTNQFAIMLFIIGVIFAIPAVAMLLEKKSASVPAQPTSTAPIPASQSSSQTSAIQQPQKQQTTGKAKSEHPTLARETILGEKQPPTGRYVTVKDKERQSGMYLLGVQGVGKSSLLENIIYQDIRKGQAVIVLDPHGDLIEHVIAQMPQERLKDTYVLSIEDTDYPFGVNLFSIAQNAGNIEQAQAVDRILHVFEKCFPETSRMLLEKYLGNIAPVFFAHAETGYAMTDIPKFLRDEAFRAKLVKKTRLFIRQFWTDEYASLSPSVQRSETASLATRLNRFLRSPIVGNIIGQSRTTIDFRKAIENKEIILLKLPVKTLPEDATLIGTMLVAQIHAAIFSFADTELEKRPGFSLFVDEFQHFATSDFAEMFTEGRKFGSRVAVAHQFRGQLPDYLASSTLTARSIITFQTTQEDAPKMAHLYPQEATLRSEDIDPTPADYLLKRAGHDIPEIDRFIRTYLLPVHSMRKGDQILVTTWEPNMGVEFVVNLMGYHYSSDPKDKPKVPYPVPYLNRWLYKAEVDDDIDLPIPYEIIYGFSNCGKGWLAEWESYDNVHKAWLTSGDVHYPPDAVIQTGPRTLEWVKPIKNSRDQLYHFIFCLHRMMIKLLSNPIGELSTPTTSDVVKKIVNLPRGHAFVKVGNEASEIETLPTPKRVAAKEVAARKERIIAQTRKKYCRPAVEVEEEIQQRLELDHPTQATSEPQVETTPKRSEEKQDWRPFDEV